MIEKITILSNSYKEILEFQVQECKQIIDCSRVVEKKKTFDIEVEFTSRIISFRNHDYTWQDLKKDRIANEYTSKIIKLEDGTYVQANINQGIWEINKKNPNVLVWKFNPEYSKPIAQYVGETSQKQIFQAPFLNQS